MSTAIHLPKGRRPLSLSRASRRGRPKAAPASAATPDRILQLGTGFFAARTVLSAAELGLFTELARGPLDAETLRRRLGLHLRGALDFFDALVALHLLERTDGQYENSREADLFLDRQKPSYVGGILEMCAHRLFAAWDSLTESLRTGEPPVKLQRGADAFAELYRTPEQLESFLKGMTGISLGTGKVIAEKFPWRQYRTFADVGAAQGAVPAQVALAHPHLQGFGYDLPVVQPVFEKYIQAQGVADRVKFAPGNFFKDPLPTVDVIILGHILHDWDLEQKQALIHKAFAALPSGGALLVYEALIDDERCENAFGLLMSLNMLIETKGGFDYTGADCQKWMRAAGFRKTRVEHLVGPDSMVIGIKP